MNFLAGLQAVAHGSDTVQYFQWRMGRGGCEKFHGAVVDHTGTENTRVFREVAQLGEALAKLTPVLGAPVPAQAALIIDWENRWAMESAVALGDNVKYIDTCRGHYQALWRQGIAMDVIAQTAEFTPYKLLVAPMLYLLKDGVAERLAQFVASGGSLVMTYWSGIVNENDLCYLGGFPGAGLRKVFGVWNEETDSLQPFDANAVRMAPGNALNMTGSFAARQICAVIHAETAQTLAVYENDYYAGQPALTLNRHGKGEAWYMASRNEQGFLDAFYAALAGRAALPRAVAAPLPQGVSAQLRRADGRDYVFLMNFTTQPQTVLLGGLRGRDLLTGAQVQGSLPLAPYGVAVVDAAAARL